MNDTTADNPQSEPGPESVPGPASAAPPRPPRLTRHPTDKVLAGVAGGLGHYFGIDPIVFRLAFVGFTILGGGGVLLYLLAWIAMPVSAPGEAPPRRGSADLGPWLGLALVVAAMLWLSGMLFDWRPSVVAALVLLAAGVLLFQHSDRQDTVPAVVPPPGAPPYGAATAAGAAPTEPITVSPPAPAPPKVRSVLGRLTLSAMLLIVAGIGLFDAAEVIEPRTGTYAASALGVIGLGLVVGAWRGRARWLIPIGLLLVPVLLVASIIPGQEVFRRGRGDVLVQPASVAQLREHYEHGAGSLILDLRAVQVPRGETRVVRAHVGMGQLTVLLPPDAPVSVRAEAGVGRVQLFDADEGGFNPSMTARENGTGGMLDLDLEVGMGEVVAARSRGTLFLPPPPPRPPFGHVLGGPFGRRLEPGVL